MVKKTQFKVLDVYDSWGARAQRAGVLYPSLGVPGLRLDDAPPRQVAQSMEELRDRWIGKLTQIRETTDNPWLQDDQNWLYTTQCFPFGMRLGRAAPAEEAYFPSRYCNYKRICPFCWARRLREGYACLHYAIYGTVDATRRMDPDTGQRQHIEPRKCDVVEVEHVRFYDCDSALEVKKLFRHLNSQRPKFHRARSPKEWGSVIVQSIEPAPPAAFMKPQALYWRVTTRCLLLVQRQAPNPPPVEFHPDRGGSYAIRRTSYERGGRVQLGRQLLAEVASRIWAYPTWLLDPGCEPRMLLHLLLSYKELRFRTTHSCGLLKNLRHRRAEARRGDMQ